MKLKPILAAFAVAVAALAQPALAEWKFTQNEKGEVTHYNGIELPPIQTVEEAHAQAQKEIAAAKKAGEAQQASAATGKSLQSEIGNQQLFFTGKPYLEETGQYLFLFRHYDPELSRWTSADPSGFPDGTNNVAYIAIPTFQLDLFGLHTIDVSRTDIWLTTYDVLPPRYEYDLFRALYNLGLSFLPGVVGVAQATVDVFGAIGSNTAPYEPGEPNHNSNFTNPVEQYFEGEWNPFGPEGYTVVKTHPLQKYVRVDYIDRFDWENKLYPYAKVRLYITQILTIE